MDTAILGTVFSTISTLTVWRVALASLGIREIGDSSHDYLTINTKRLSPYIVIVTAQMQFLPRKILIFRKNLTDPTNIGFPEKFSFEILGDY